MKPWKKWRALKRICWDFEKPPKTDVWDRCISCRHFDPWEIRCTRTNKTIGTFNMPKRLKCFRIDTSIPKQKP